MVAVVSRPAELSDAAAAILADPVGTLRDDVRRLAKRLAQKARGSGVEYADMVNVGLAAVWRAAPEYDPARGAGPRTYLLDKARFAMIDEARHTGTYTRRHLAAVAGGRGGAFVQLRVGVAFVDGSRKEMTPACLADPHGVEHDDGLRAEFRAAARRLSGCNLHPSDLDLLERYFVDGVTMKQIGREMGLSESRVSQLITMRLDVIREACAERGDTLFTCLS